MYEDQHCGLILKEGKDSCKTLMPLIFHFEQISNDYKVYAVKCHASQQINHFGLFGFGYITYVGIALQWEKEETIHFDDQTMAILAMSQFQYPRQMICLLAMEIGHSLQHYTDSSWLQQELCSYHSLHILAT